MRRIVILSMFLFTPLASVTNYGNGMSFSNYKAVKVESRGQITISGILSPGKLQVLEPFLPVNISWALDDLQPISSQDLILSTDGGMTFDTKIAANLVPERRQLIWSPLPENATEKAKLEVVFRLKSGEIREIVSDVFSILPEPRTQSLVTKSINAVIRRNIDPRFANPGPCVTGETPLINYNMTHPTQCSSLYRGEPSLAQDPTNANHFFTATGAFSQTARVNSTANWAFTGSSTTQGFNFSGLNPRGDVTAAIGADGTIYVVSLASTTPIGTIDKIVVFRSKTGGSTFEPGVAIPGTPDTFVDKPVICVNPGNNETLAVTFNTPNIFPGTRVAICKQASTGNLSSQSIWGISAPKNPDGIDLPTQGSTHSLIDPINSSTYRLFIVQTNDVVSSPPTTVGFTVYQYQVDQGQLTLGNATRKVTQGVGAPPWSASPTCRAIEEAVRATSGCSYFGANFTKAAIDYCDPNSRRMYIPTHADTRGIYSDGLSSDLFVTVWQYTGTETITTQRILPGEKEKYVACAVTDGHGRVWINAYMVAAHPNNPNNGDNQRAQMGAIAINRRTGVPGEIAYMSLRLPGNTSLPVVFLGDYVYTEATFHPSSGGSRMTSPTYSDAAQGGGCGHPLFRINLSGWQ